LLSEHDESAWRIGRVTTGKQEVRYV
jgi:hypothetical protein